jgi:PHP family Zn ribbon phosphoesterase
MVNISDYRFVKYCRLCNKRFVINRGDKVNSYCDDCIKKFKKEGKE